MIFYDENGNVITLEISDNSAALEALELQNKNLEKIIENQAAALEKTQEQNETLSAIVEYQNEFITTLQETSQERYETLLAHTEAQEAKIAEMNQYTAYIFVIVLAFMLYRILSGALSSMFGGG